jgi:ferredoxin, 2Fe-2S
LEQAPQQSHPDEIFLLVIDREGREHALPAIEGWRVMEVIRDWGIDLRATCGGACACAGCHVYVDQPWIGRLGPPSAEEEDRLDEAFGVETTSRLCCQILMSSELSGLRVRLAPGSELE